MWPFTSKKPKATVQLRCTQEYGYEWWAVYVWKREPLLGGYWNYVKGSRDKEQMRNLYRAHLEGRAFGESIVVEQA